MEQDTGYRKINEIVVKIIDLTLFVGTGLGLIVFLLGLLNYTESEIKLSYLVEFIVLTAFVTISVFRKKISTGIKSLFIILGIFALIVVDIIKLGIYSDSKILLIIIPFYSFLVYSLRKTTVIYALAVASFLLLAYLHLSGAIEPGIDLIERTHKLNPWLINTGLITIVSFIIVVIMRRFSQTYNTLLSDLEKSNKEISEKERNYREIFNTSTDAIFIHDLKGNIIDVNDSMLKMYGYGQDEIGKLNMLELSSGREGYTADDAIILINKALEGGAPVFDWHAKKKDGELFWVQVALKKSNIGNEERILAVVRDINEKKEDELQLDLYRKHLKDIVALRTHELEHANEELRLSNDKLGQQKEELMAALNELERTQEQLIHSEKMASLGVLASGVAHEINNPLNFISTGAVGLEQYIEEQLPGHLENIKPLLVGIREGVERTTNIITGLDHYSKTSNRKYEDCNVDSIIDNCLLMLENKIKDKIEVKKDFTNEAFRLYCNNGHLHQVILNVLTNSVQAINKKGKITIQTLKKAKEIIISVKDTGSGMTKEQQAKVFDPFYTTKEPGQGTGLGMSISLKIIKDYGDKIEYISSQGKGTEAIITLPLTGNTEDEQKT